MKFIFSTLTVLFLLLATGACAHILSPLLPVQVPTPMPLPAHPLLPPDQGNRVPTAAVSTGAAVCSCPTFLAATPPSRIIQPPPVICNCPAILIPPSAQATAVELTTMTLEDNGKTFILQPGERFLLNLDLEQFIWTVAVDNQKVLSRVPNIPVIQGTQGVYETHDPGQAILTAVGDPLCRSSKPMCMMPSMIFKITIIVR